MVLTLIAIADLAQADGAGHVLQLAIAVGGASQAVQRVVGDVQLHDAAAQLGELLRLRRYVHAGLDWRVTRRRCASPARDFDEAEAAGTEGLQAVR
jgi:hypothetical protein